MARFAVVLILALSPTAAQAYIGPGAGITAIGSVLAVFAVLMLAIVGFVWYPIKRLLAKLTKSGSDTSQTADKIAVDAQASQPN